MSCHTLNAPWLDGRPAQNNELCARRDGPDLAGEDLVRNIICRCNLHELGGDGVRHFHAVKQLANHLCLRVKALNTTSPASQSSSQRNKNKTKDSVCGTRTFPHRTLISPIAERGAAACDRSVWDVTGFDYYGTTEVQGMHTT